ncbi:MAG: hypothetical protein HUU01_07430 [Saprospiraceae bacterium]|nr:hypothetical protein [Saprospiraceae bacterium]
MKKKNILFQVFLGLVACFFCSCSSGSLNGWEKIQVPSVGDFRPLGIAENSKAILAFGYDEEEFDCGFLGFQNCRKFKIFRSRDNGKIWEEITDPELAERHAITKGDKLMPQTVARLTQKYAKVVYISKRVIDMALYTEIKKPGVYFADGDNFYLYQDFILYHSKDFGDTWEEMSIEYDYVLPIQSSATIDIIDDFLVVHDANTSEKFVFKKEGNLFKFQDRNNFYILHHYKGNKELKFEGECKLCRYYNVLKNTKTGIQTVVPLDGVVSGNYHMVSEFFFTKKNNVIGNFSIMKSDSIAGNFAAFFSEDQGQSFGYNEYPTNIDYTDLEGFSIEGFYKGKPLIFFSERSLAVNGNVFVQTAAFAWNIRQLKAEFVQTPDVNGIANFTNFLAGFYPSKKHLYYYQKKGLFRIPCQNK